MWLSQNILILWIPHALANGMRFIYIPFCQSLLLRSPCNEFLEELLTGDESGFYTTPMHTVPFGYVEEKSS